MMDWPNTYQDLAFHTWHPKNTAPVPFLWGTIRKTAFLGLEAEKPGQLGMPSQLGATGHDVLGTAVLLHQGLP